MKGFCPSFVTVHGGKPKKGRAVAEGDGAAAARRRCLPKIGEPYGIIVTGIGGTGVVTIGGVLGMAAHLEGKGVGIIDMAGLAQKGGAVYSHIRIANKPEDIHAIRIAAGGRRSRARRRHRGGRQQEGAGGGQARRDPMIINLAEFLPGDFTRNADFSLPMERMKRAIVTAAGRDQVSFIDATRLATALMGNSIAANMFMVGYAFQQGALPLSAESIEKAIEMNGEAVAMNQAAFRWGRRAALDAAAVEKLIPNAGREDDNRTAVDSRSTRSSRAAWRS